MAAVHHHSQQKFSKEGKDWQATCSPTRVSSTPAHPRTSVQRTRTPSPTRTYTHTHTRIHMYGRLTAAGSIGKKRPNKSSKSESGCEGTRLGRRQAAQKGNEQRHAAYDGGCGCVRPARNSSTTKNLERHTHAHFHFFLLCAHPHRCVPVPFKYCVYISLPPLLTTRTVHR